MPSKEIMTRRTAIQLSAGLPAVVWTRAWGFAPREFWNDKPPSNWTPAEIQDLLTKSPWTREATIHDTAPVGSAGSSRMGGGGRRGGRVAPTPSSGGGASSIPLVGAWKATVRWESARLIREALGNVDLPGMADQYVLNLLGNLPGPVIDPDENEEKRQRTLELLKDHTQLEHKGDQVALSRVALSPPTAASPAGTLFYFSRELALRLSDKVATFTTRIGTLDVKCKFALKEMLYRGHLDL
jgi:hypothetical protein